jgi:RimJ/RimL family protein N-acetyltransferase
VEFQGIDWVCNSQLIARNPQFVAIYECRKADLQGRVAFPLRGAVISGPGEGIDFYKAAEASKDGNTIIGMPSRNANGESNILFSIEKSVNQLRLRESIHVLATEYGVALLKWRPLRERAQAIIDVAHPDDREDLIKKAREKNILYSNQIFVSHSAHLYPSYINYTKTFKGGKTIRFRAMKPSYEEAMRRFFYRCSNETVFYRFFYSVKTMSHDKMQAYVNVDYTKEFSVVGFGGKKGENLIVAEARLVGSDDGNAGEVAFLIDENYQGAGVGSYLMSLLVDEGKRRMLDELYAEVLPDNQPMIKVFEKSGLPLKSKFDNGVYHVTLSLKG